MRFTSDFNHILIKFYCFGVQSAPSLVVKSLLPKLAARDSSIVFSSYCGILIQIYYKCKIHFENVAGKWYNTAKIRQKKFSNPFLCFNTPLSTFIEVLFQQRPNVKYASIVVGCCYPAGKRDNRGPF